MTRTVIESLLPFDVITIQSMFWNLDELLFELCILNAACLCVVTGNFGCIAYVVSNRHGSCVVVYTYLIAMECSQM